MDQSGNFNTAQPAQPVAPRTSGLAIASFVMGLVCLTCIFWPMLALPAIICGIIALVKISGSKGTLKGTGFAITGIVIPSVMIVLVPLLLAILMPALGRVKTIAQRTICSTNLQGLGNAMIVYANDYDGQLPPADQWCDLLISETDVYPGSLICPDSDAVEGESSYAININAAGKKLDELPADMVLLFETELGKEEGPRTEIIEARANSPVYPKRWNQAGGPEIMSTPHSMHTDETGCNIVFIDGHVEFVSGDALQNLLWTQEKAAEQCQP